jgi:hypothetical protein
MAAAIDAEIKHRFKMRSVQTEAVDGGAVRARSESSPLRSKRLVELFNELLVRF